jgi:hypothetical protein
MKRDNLKQTKTVENLKKENKQKLKEKQKNQKENLLKRKRYENESEQETFHLTSKELKQLVDTMSSKSTLKMIRKISCFDYPKLKELYQQESFLPNLLKQLLNQQQTENQFEVIWILTSKSFSSSHQDISSGTTEDVKRIEPFFEYLIPFLSNLDNNLREQTCWVFGNVLIEKEYKVKLMEIGILNSLFHLLKSNNNSILRIASWSISNFYRGIQSDFIPIEKEQLHQILKIFKNTEVNYLVIDV